MIASARCALLLTVAVALLLVPSVVSAQSGVRHVHPTDPTCGSRAPCYTSIQAAVDAAVAGEHVVLQAGTYVEQVTVAGRNAAAAASEQDRIVIEADPAAPPGSVVLQGAVTQCSGGHAVRFRQSRFVTLRGLTITGAGGPAVALMGGINQNQAIHLERLRIFGNGSASCDGGITIARGNPDTLVVNSLVHGNGRSGLATLDADGGPHYVVGNTFHRNHWSGISVTRAHVVFLVNNLITGNGVASGSTGGRFGVKREPSTSPQPAGIHLLNNVICGNRLGEIDGPVLDPSDGGNLTPTGSEGPGAGPSPGCDTMVYADHAGPDGVPDTGDDDFRLAEDSPALDIGIDPRTLGLPPAYDVLLETDFTGVPGARPRNATAAATARFDAGALEASPRDETAPVLTILAPPPSAHVRGLVTVEALATDQGDGVTSLGLRIGAQMLAATLTPSLPPSATSVRATAAWDTIASADGAHTLSAAASDAAGNRGSVSRVLVADNSPPETTIDAGPAGDVAATGVTLQFSGSDNLTPPAGLRFAWRLDGGPWSAFSPVATASVAGLGEGTHTFEVKARDLAGNEDPSPAALTFTVRLGPTIDAVEPSSGPVGTFVTISGQRFVAGTTTVRFSGVPAVVRTVTSSQVTTTVPPGATTGQLVVATTQGAPAAAPFTVTLTGDFALTAVPATVRVIAGDRAAVTVAATGTGGFTGLVGLRATPATSGITTAFDSASLAPGGASTLTLDVPPGAAGGSYPVLISGTASIDGQAVTRGAHVTLQVLPASTTGVAGRIMTAETVPRPIPGVTIALGSAFVVTDAAGNFVLLAPPPGPSMLFVDGRTASTATAQFPIVEVRLDVAATGVTQVPFTIYLPILDTANAIDLPLDAGGFTTREVKATTPAIPGLIVTVPQGTRIVGPDGNPVAQLVITPVPINRSPMPFPPDVAPRLLFAINPGGAVPSQPLPITFPNAGDAMPGSSADLHYFDLVAGDWSVWGQGTVTADGTRIASNPGAGLPRLAWHFAFLSVSDQVRSRHARAGDPVDLVTGRFTMTKMDLALPGRLPVLLQRTYRSEHAAPGLFGSGWNLAPYDTLLAEVGAGPSLNLVLPDQSSYLFTYDPATGEWRTSGEPFLAGAVITRLPGDYNFRLRYKDGTVHRYQRIPPLAAAGLGAIEDPNGNVLTIERSGAPFDRRILSLSEPAGRQLVFSYEAGRVTQVADPLGRRVLYGYDAQGRLRTVTDPAGGVTTYAYEGNTPRITTVTDARGITYLTNEYTAQGRVTRQTQADGSVWQFSYFVPTPSSGDGCPDGNCRAVPPAPFTAVTDPRGHVTGYEFDSTSGVWLGSGQGFTTAIRDALGQVTHLDTQGVPIKDALGRVTTPEYDANMNLVSVTDAAGHVRRFTYEPTFNRLTSLTDPLGQTTGFEYDARGNLIAIVDPLGHRTAVGYDQFGQPVSYTDPLGHTTLFGHDASGNVTSITDPLGNRTTRQYDGVGRLTRQTDPRGKATTFAYDALNRLTTVTDALGGVTRLTYDANGNVLTVTDARGGVTTHAYDAMDRVASRIDPVGATETFEYDAMGNLTRHVDRKGQVSTFTYDAMNRRVTSAYADGGTAFEYDAVGRLISASEAAGGRLLFAYDALDRLVGEVGPLGSVSYGYDAAGRRTRMSAPGMTPVAYGYDAASRLASISQAPLSVATLQYDAAGRRSRLTLPNQVSTEYQYDVASRLTALIYRNAGEALGDLGYDYDAAGNRITVGGSYARTAVPAAVTTASYDLANRQLGFGAATLTYDANGSLVTVTDPAGVTQLTWDARGRLSAVNTPEGAASFGYDALGRRMERRIGDAATGFLHDGLDVIQELSATAVPYLRTLTLDEPLVRGTDEFYLTDALGSVVALTSPTGLPTAAYTYEPFGRTTTDGESSNPVQFTGREQDATGFYYYRARYYHPALQRFVKEDPIGLGGGSNVYVYADNRPVDHVDPLGLDAFVTIFRSGQQPFGHAGIGVDTTATVGFYPVDGVPVSEILRFRAVPGRVMADDAPHLRLKETFRIPTSPEQDGCLAQFIAQRTAHPGMYYLGGRSCGEFVRDALQSCGVKAVGPGGPVAPFGLADRLRITYQRWP